ncbi:hypothetical protein RB10427 [Rhodopirellula baltica SH 1]|uniref:Uncharacterized protein n=1 Tax=Rhodopirellula baltica (strain DSM 10527 / NCIMB 13988 / SH1) TaxID=243090 RepID=Q7UF07_RHOBA|nr:hypothetical protein RB10427 [Rhodopirellula baltica SH 1]
MYPLINLQLQKVTIEPNRSPSKSRKGNHRFRLFTLAKKAFPRRELDR